MAITYHSGGRIQGLSTDLVGTGSVVHSVTSGTSDYSLTSSNRGHANEIHGSSVLIGQTIGSISFEFKGTDTGLIRGLILNGGTGGIVADCGTIDSSTVTSSYAWYEFTCSPYTLQSGDRLAFELLGSGTTLQARGTSSSTDGGLRWYIVPSGSYPKNLSYQNTNEINVKVSDSIDTKPTDVPDYTRLEETDTRKIYSYLPISKTGLKAYWKFNESSGNIINQATAVGSSDSLGTGADLTVTGATYGATGKIGDALDFDGTNDFGDVGTSTSQFNFFHDGSDWSINLWFKMTAFTANMKFMMNQASSVTRGMYLAFGDYDTQLNLNVVSSNGTMTTGGSTIPAYGTGTFKMVTVKYTSANVGTEFEYFIDADSKDTKVINSAGSSGNADMDMSIAVHSGESAQLLDGLLDEFTIWSRALTDTEITTLYNSGSGKAIDTASWKEKGTI